ncbi:MAG: glycosyl hydrolase [Legionella sp.]|nr:glycosyl hydrolase [Legionella sp.]
MDKNDRRARLIKFINLVLLIISLNNIALANSSDPTLIFPATENSQKPSAFWLNNKKPYPTNAWFINFVLGEDKNTPSYPVNIFPYLAQISPEGISLSYTNSIYYKEPAYPDFVSALYYQFENQLTLGTVEEMDNYGVESYHGLKINLQWKNDKQQMMTAPIVQGSPYVTTIFSNTTPKLSSGFKLISVNEQTSRGIIAPANRFELIFATDALNQQTWILYSETPITLHWEYNAGKVILSTKVPYTGWLRLVLQKDSRTNLKNDPGELDAFSQTIPLDYQQTYYSTDERVAYSFIWQTQNAKVPLLLSLPHQRATPDLLIAQSKVSYQGIKGQMTGETKARWEIELPNVPIVFLEPKKYSEEQKKDLHKALIKDINELLTNPFPDDGPYQVGKRLTRAARILLIADQLNENNLKDKLLARLKKVLGKKMLGNKGWRFEYDTTWGGIIPSVNDYGARHYNDHHYHYGYWVYTIAVMGKFDPDWLNNPLQPGSFSPKQWTDNLIRDYANKNHYDPYYPAQRHQDDYAGHSWASGLSAFKDGQNQQSSSEAVHAYYALALYAKVINDKPLYNWANFLMARELKAAQIYWQIQKTNAVYSEIFKANNNVIANLWDSKVDVNAFFTHCKTKYRCGLEYSYGIEMLPFTAITSHLLNKEWLKDSYPTLMNLINNKYGEITAAWQWILLKGLVPILTAEEKKYYFSKAVDSNPEEYDNGDSKTNTLYYLIND